MTVRRLVGRAEKVQSESSIPVHLGNVGMTKLGRSAKQASLREGRVTHDKGGHFMMRSLTLILVSALAIAVSAGVGTRAATVAEFYDLAKPNGDGPFPAVVLAPGCGGFHDQYSPPVFDRYRKRLVDDGFVVVNVDFTKGHDIPTCYSDKLLITQDEYSTDILNAVTDLKKNGFVDPARIHLLGWSYGGGSVLNALAVADEQPNARIKSVVAYYPYCDAVRPWKLPVPVLVLRGDADDIAPFGLCMQAVQGALDNKSMRVVVYPGALHSFDQFTVPQPVKNDLGTFGYNEAATKNAWTETEMFLKQ